jgi:hypothetical protein
MKKWIILVVLLLSLGCKKICSGKVMAIVHYKGFEYKCVKWEAMPNCFWCRRSNTKILYFYGNFVVEIVDE